MQKFNPFFLFTVSALIFLFASCANIVSPSGGPLDQQAPMVVKELPKNGQVYFSGRQIEVCFDEFITINEAEKNITISPPLQKKPTISVNGKCIQISIDKTEQLQSNTTYTINFAGAISDINESNRLPDYSYAFSTGPFIDSLSLVGSVTNAFTRQKIDGFTIGLYKNLCDSCLQKQKPLFYTKSIQGGFFKLRRIKAGKYYVAGFKDENSNGMADRGELLAFLPNMINIADSGLIINLFAYTSPLYPPNTIIDTVNPGYGVVGLVFYRNTFRPLVKTLLSYRWSAKHEFDTLYLYSPDYKNFHNSIELKYPEGKTTISGLTGRENKKALLSISSYLEEDTILIFCSNPFTHYNKDSIRLTKDTIPVPIKVIKRDSFYLSIIPIKPLMPGTYQLSVRGEAITDIFKNSSTISNTYLNIKKTEESGSIGIKVINPKKEDLIIVLVDEKEQEFKNIRTSSSGEFKIPGISPGTYRIKVVFDTNKNGFWDYGDIDHRLLPEKVVYLLTTFLVRPDWDLDNNIIDIDKLK